MTKAGRQKAEAAHQVPQSVNECARGIARVGHLQRELATVQGRMNEELGRVKERYEARARPCEAELKALSKGIQTYCEAHRTELTKDGRRKTVKLATGSIAWRARPPKVSIRGVAEVIERLRAGRLKRFLRIKTEVDKEALLKEPKVAETIEGVKIGQGEDFVITPFAASIDGDGK